MEQRRPVVLQSPLGGCEAGPAGCVSVLSPEHFLCGIVLVQQGSRKDLETQQERDGGILIQLLAIGKQPPSPGGETLTYLL